MKFRLLLEYDAQAGRWSAVFPDLPGCSSAGDTEEEAVAHAKEALALWFDSTPVDIPKNGKLLEVALPGVTASQSVTPMMSSGFSGSMASRA